MRRDELLRLLREQPFRPFRMRFSNGVVHEIRHPDMAIVTPSAVYVGISANTAPDAAEDIVIVALVHIVQIEYVSPQTTTSTK
jgi:hypothetical protein